MPKIKILGDSPTTEDGLGFDSYAKILSDAINNFDVTSPLTIGIHGSWGSGKTSLMQMLEKKFKSYSFSIDLEFEEALNNGNITKLKDIFMDNRISLSSNATVKAVAQSKNPVNERPNGVLYRKIHNLFCERSNYGTSSVAKNKEDEWMIIDKESIYIAKKEQGKVNIYKGDNSFKTIWFNAWVHGREEPIGLALLHQMLTELQKEDGSKEKIVNVLANVGKLLVDAGLRKTTGITFEEARELFETSIKTKSTLRDDFQKVMDECLPDNKRLVVFIDDLDRCLPEKTIKILEVIKLFLDVPRCVFVIGVAREVIEQGIAVIYKIGEQEKPIEGKDYIEKIIQIPFTLPPIREEVMIRFIENLGYLFMFSWDNVSGNDNEGLLKFLRDNLDIDWAEKAKISKSDDCKTILISTDENSAEIELDEKEEKATLKVRDGKTYDLKVKKENGKLNIYSLGISEKEKKYAKIVAKGTEYNPRKVKLFLNTLRIRQAIADKSGGELNPAIAAKLFVIEYTFDDFYKDVKNYREQDFLWEVERLARGEVYLFSWDNVPGNDSERLRRFLRDDLDIDWAGNAEISKSDDRIYIIKDKNLAEIVIDDKKEQATLRISSGETYDLKVKKENDIYWEVDKELRDDSKKSGTLLKKYCENEALMSLLKDEPFFGRINIDAYVYLSEIKPPEPEEVLGFDKSKLKVLLSGDLVKMNHTASEVRKMPNSDKKHYVNAIIPELTDDNKDDVRANAAVALGMIGDANAVKPLKARLIEDKNVDVLTKVAVALGEIGDAEAVEPLIKALEDKEGDVNVHVGATGALGEIGDAKAVEPLITALNDKDIAVRNKAEKALVKIGDEAVGSLIGKLDEVLQKQGYSRMRECAARTLGRIGDVRAINVLEKVANKDNYSAIRTVAKYALKEIEAKQKQKKRNPQKRAGGGTMAVA